MEALATYRPSGCHLMFGCSVTDDIFRVGPVGWTLDIIAEGQYKVTPLQRDVPNVRQAIVICTLQSFEDLPTVPDLLGTTFGVKVVDDGGYWVIYALDIGKKETPLSAPFFLLVLNLTS